MGDRDAVAPRCVEIHSVVSGGTQCHEAPADRLEFREHIRVHLHVDEGADRAHAAREDRGFPGQVRLQEAKLVLPRGCRRRRLTIE